MVITQKSLLKGTILFGLSQIVISLFLILRAKMLALYIGPSGLGDFGLISGLLIALITVFQLGIDRSSVKGIVNISSIKNFKNFKISALNSLVMVLCFFSILIIFIFRKQVSVLTFGSSAYVNDILITSLSVAMMISTSVHYSILRGLQDNRLLIKTMIIGNVIGITLSLPIILYYSLFNISLILLIPALINYISSSWALKTKEIVLSFSYENIVKEFTWIKIIIREGITIAIASVIVSLAAYTLKTYIYSSDDGVRILGFYVAAFSILNNYFGALFSAITMDYYPKIVQIIDDKEPYKKAVNSQTNISVFFLLPLILILHRFSESFIYLLYSEDFLLISNLIIVGCIAVYFKALTWSMGVSFMAKGHVRLLAFSELLNNSVLVIASLFFYETYGLIGLAYGYLVSNIYSYIQTLLLCYFLYSYRFSIKTIFIISLGLIFILLSTFFQLNNYSDSILSEIFFYIIPVTSCLLYIYYMIFKSNPE